MWDMAKSSMTLFFQGRLFADPAKVYRQLAMGVLVTAALLVVLAALGAPPWLAALVGGAVGGAMQSYLFKDLRYR